MARRLKATYRCEPVGELARQLLFSPAKQRAQQVRRAEKLHDEIEPGVNYPLDFVAYRVTGYRSDEGAETVLVGEAVAGDLRLLIDALSRASPVETDEKEEVETAEELAARLRVSTKTLSRWRGLGLRWRWVKGSGDGGARLVYPMAATERFMREHGGKVARAAGFTRMSREDQGRLIERARRIARGREVTLNRVAAHLAKKTGRALETIRRVLEKHDKKNAGSRIFEGRARPLTEGQRRTIARAHRMGVAMGKMCERFGRTRSTIRRAIVEARADGLRGLEIHYIRVATFDREDADAVYLREEEAEQERGKGGGESRGEQRGEKGGEKGVEKGGAMTADLPEEIAGLYEQAGLSGERQRGLLLRMNYLCYKAARLREGLSRVEPGVKEMEKIEGWLAEAGRIRSRVARGSLRMVLSVARKHLIGRKDATAAHVMGLLEEGHGVLLEAIEQFDPAGKQSFEAHLTWNLMRRFAAVDPAAGSGGGEQGQVAERARKKEAPERVLKRMIERARAKGVELEEKAESGR